MSTHGREFRQSSGTHEVGSRKAQRSLEDGSREALIRKSLNNSTWPMKSAHRRELKTSSTKPKRNPHERSRKRRTHKLDSTFVLPFFCLASTQTKSPCKTNFTVDQFFGMNNYINKFGPRNLKKIHWNLVSYNFNCKNYIHRI